ncbi:MAG TPA: integrase core domain-containing protein [Isosphaeraceae bacterium]|jgi:Integrase core domain/Homeodomain-like domain|nr:integrase core domain-containing protein [Isosphaeraceae bacterium]
MNDELGARHRAITLRLAGRPVQAVCAAVGRSEVWFRKWWHRYLEAGPEGLYDLTRANHHVALRLPPELERTILSIRRRLQAHATPAARYRMIGAGAILAELKRLGVRPLPCERTIERVLQRHGLTAPRVRLAPLLPRQEYPGPQARASNQLHEVDLVGPVYLKGSGHRYYIWVGKDAFDGAVCLRLAGSRRMDEVLGFLGECWKDLGRPEQVQFDNARELAGWGPAARTLSRVIRLCLRYGVGPVFIPAGEPQFNGSVENFNGWFQEPLFQRRFRRPGDLRRELARLQEAVNTQHVHPRLGGQTPAQHRRGLRLQKLPASFVAPTGRLPLTAGRVTFIRRVSVAGTVTVLSQSFRVGKRHRGLYLRLVVDTGRGWLTAYLNGRVLKRWPYKLLND